jgi:hypothetical protein
MQGSPLFARIAARYIDDGMPASALGILHPGIESNPEYVTGYVVAAKALITLRHYNEARAMLARAFTLLPECPAARTMLESIAELELTFPPDHGLLPDNESTAAFSPAEKSGRQRTRLSRQEDLIGGTEDVFGSASGEQRQNEESRRDLPEPDIFRSDTETGVPGSNELERLARALETARMPALEADDVLQPEAEERFGLSESVDLHSRPVTETLAEIYVRQGKAEEAIETYLTLCVRHPERREEFISRIAELQRSMEDFMDPGGS